MGESLDLVVLLSLVALIGVWMKFSRAREIAMDEARRQCERHGLQLLDETVGLRGIRLRHHRGERVLERCYGFEVSIDGDDREPGKLWMVGSTLSGLNLPTIRLRPSMTEPPQAVPTGSNVVSLRRPDRPPLH